MSAFERRVKRLRERYYEQVARREAVQAKRRENSDEDGLNHVGAGWYELPNGERVRGKEAAQEALAALEAGMGDGGDEM